MPSKARKRLLFGCGTGDPKMVAKVVEQSLCLLYACTLGQGLSFHELNVEIHEVHELLTA